MNRLALLGIVAVTLIGCASGPLAPTGSKMNQVSTGMARAEVESILGKPDGVRQAGGSTWYKYNHRLTSGWSWDKADYHVVFVEGRVTEYGQGEVRVAPNNTFMIISARP